jgi:hypothetical protein
MTATKIFSDNKRMYNRLFWLDWISRLWFIGSGIYAVGLIYALFLHLQPGAQQTLTLPIDQSDPAAKGQANFDGMTSVVSHTVPQFTQMTVTLAHISAPAVILLGASDILAAVISAALAWFLFRFVWHLRQGQPFAASTARTMTAAGIIVGAGFTVSALLRALAYGQIGLVGFNGRDGITIGIAGGQTGFDFMPLFIAGVLFALAGVFRYGAELQRETDGLV